MPEQIIFGNVSKRKLRYYFAEDRLPNYRQVPKSRLRSHEQRLAFDQECKSFVQVENRLLPKIVRHMNN